MEGAASRYPANGQLDTIRPYRKTVMKRAGRENKVRFDVYSLSLLSYTKSCYAYASPSMAAELHRQHLYVVRFNSDPGYPRIEEIVEQLGASPG